VRLEAGWSSTSGEEPIAGLVGAARWAPIDGRFIKRRHRRAHNWEHLDCRQSARRQFEVNRHRPSGAHQCLCLGPAAIQAPKVNP